MVDDDSDDRKIFSQALEMVDPSLQVLFADNGVEALKIIQSGTFPDVVFCDVNMPIMNGLELLETIKKTPEFQSLRVMMYTTSPSENYRSKCNELGAMRYIVKPTAFEEVCSEIKAALEEIANQ